MPSHWSGVGSSLAGYETTHAEGRIVAIDAAEIINIAHDAAEELVRRAG